MDKGVGMDMLRQAYAADSLQGGVTAAAIPGYIQFMQNWLAGLVTVITAARKIDELVGISTVGSWEDEQVLQRVLEMTGYTPPYTDYGNVPLSDWNMVTVPRTVVRFELGMRVGVLEEKRAAREGVNTSQWKRESCALQLEIGRNLIGFNGYNSGQNNTYGFLNDPGLPSYVSVANGASGSGLWSSKTLLEICADIRAAAAALQNQSQDNINPEDVATTLAVPTIAYQYLSTISDLGYSVRSWIEATYKGKMRVVSAPQLNTANGGSGVFYLYAEQFKDNSTDSGRVWEHVVPAKFMVLGVQKLAKGYEEDYTNATAGVMLKRPFAVVRYTGIS
jgi:hypothetical protein